MRPSLWGLVFVAVVMSWNPGVDIPLSHAPTLALVMGSLTLVLSWLAAVRRTTPARSTVNFRIRPRRNDAVDVE